MSGISDEQQSELDALSAIYADQYTFLSFDPVPSFEIRLSATVSDPALLPTTRTQLPYDDSEDGEQEESAVVSEISCVLTFRIPFEYPAVDPDISVHSLDGTMTKKDESDLREFLFLQISALGLSGQVMVFSLVSEALQWMQTRVDENAKEATRKEDEALVEWRRRQIAQLEAEQAASLRATRFDEDQRVGGTLVTRETFAQWKLQFDEEKRVEKEKENARKKAAAIGPGSRMTGRQFFEMFTLSMEDLEGELEFAEDENIPSVDIRKAAATTDDKNGDGEVYADEEYEEGYEDENDDDDNGDDDGSVQDE
eukprot:ANDGO_07852.mRNA.1 RWD domain-containing protein 1 OS=Rattus norvegicus GN=Rwdd1 PE=2 SV=1